MSLYRTKGPKRSSEGSTEQKLKVLVPLLVAKKETNIFRHFVALNYEFFPEALVAINSQFCGTPNFVRKNHPNISL